MADLEGTENQRRRRKNAKNLPTPNCKEDTERDPRSVRRSKITVVCRLF